ncbi:ABC transporter permease [Halobaculum sp. CBA1158]|uniref:ABC transporter permease n=1 Tax=Halobaculum sp. CBA1158 TaxID=2904243 RepID=UPI001F432D81|nr:ABC transporter permease [Halobaculum sp. CBA1158]UIO99776.1 ABC transporter permease [Halobaculum sp. CBA1158]
MAAETGTTTVVDEYQRERLYRFARSVRHNTKAVVGLALILGLVVLAVVSPMMISQEAANEMNVQDRFAPPSAEHPFGTDNFGRDMLSRTLLGVRISLYVGLTSVAISSAVGVPLGGLAGYAGGAVDDLVMRTMDILMSFPPILVAMTITAVIGPTLNNAILALGLVYIPYFARVTRSEAISVSQEEFVEAAEALGERDSYILFREVLPNAAAPIIVQASISISFAILAAAGLSFLGLGAQPPTPSWGLMLQQAKQYLTQAPWMAIFPGLGIAVTVLGFNLFGDGIRDVLDPNASTEFGVADE